MKTLNLSDDDIDVLLYCLKNAPKILAAEDMYWPASGKWAISYDLTCRLRSLRNGDNQ